MDRKWEIIYYETSQGKSPIFEFIHDLDIKVQNKIATVLDLLEDLCSSGESTILITPCFPKKEAKNRFKRN